MGGFVPLQVLIRRVTLDHHAYCHTGFGPQGCVPYCPCVTTHSYQSYCQAPLPMCLVLTPTRRSQHLVLPRIHHNIIFHIFASSRYYYLTRTFKCSAFNSILNFRGSQTLSHVVLGNNKLNRVVPLIYEIIEY